MLLHCYRILFRWHYVGYALAFSDSHIVLVDSDECAMSRESDKDETFHRKESL